MGPAELAALARCLQPVLFLGLFSKSQMVAWASRAGTRVLAALAPDPAAVCGPGLAPRCPPSPGPRPLRTCRCSRFSNHRAPQQVLQPVVDRMLPHMAVGSPHPQTFCACLSALAEALPSLLDAARYPAGRGLLPTLLLGTVDGLDRSDRYVDPDQGFSLGHSSPALAR